VTLTEFLAARLDEDEAAAKAAQYLWPLAALGVLDDKEHAAWYPLTIEAAGHIARWDPARVLREVEAKRKILAEYQRLYAEINELVVHGREPGHHMDAMRALHVAVCAHAAVYSDHPDYNPAWVTDSR
jgi:hypothetical protein